MFETLQTNDLEYILKMPASNDWLSITQSETDPYTFSFTNDSQIKTCISRVKAVINKEKEFVDTQFEKVGIDCYLKMDDDPLSESTENIIIVKEISNINFGIINGDEPIKYVFKNYEQIQKINDMFCKPQLVNQKDDTLNLQESIILQKEIESLQNKKNILLNALISSTCNNIMKKNVISQENEIFKARIQELETQNKELLEKEQKSEIEKENTQNELQKVNEIIINKVGNFSSKILKLNDINDKNHTYIDQLEKDLHIKTSQTNDAMANSEVQFKEYKITIDCQKENILNLEKKMPDLNMEISTLTEKNSKLEYNDKVTKLKTESLQQKNVIQKQQSLYQLKQQSSLSENKLSLKNSKIEELKKNTDNYKRKNVFLAEEIGRLQHTVKNQQLDSHNKESLIKSQDKNIKKLQQSEITYSQKYFFL